MFNEQHHAWVESAKRRRMPQQAVLFLCATPLMHIAGTFIRHTFCLALMFAAWQFPSQ